MCFHRFRLVIAFALSCGQCAFAQRVFSWQELRDRFLATNPTLLGGELSVQETRDLEITAYLRPNPDFSVAADQFQPFNTNPYRPLSPVSLSGASSYLHERAHKRELRLEDAQRATAVAASQQADLTRTLLFTLRSAFIQTLQAKAVQAQAVENLSGYDHVLSVSRDRKAAGDIAQMDLDRLELQRVQFETDLQNATVNLRTAKIQLLSLLNDRSPIDQFDVTGKFDFDDQIPTLADLRQSALETRPDLRAAVESVMKSKTDHKLAVANGSTDPVFGMNFGHNPPLTQYLGLNVTIPLRIFDRNQGEKARTLVDIQRTEKLRDAAEAQVLADVNSSYAVLSNVAILLKSYRDKYLKTASQVRETVEFAYQNGGLALLDLLQAEQDYRAIQVSYLNLVGSYLTAAGQLNQAVGREVIQ